LSKHGDYASHRLDAWQPRGIGGRLVKGVAKGVRAVDRATGKDPHNTTDGDPTKCHMRARKNGKECGANLKTRAMMDQGHCGHHICANEYTAYTSNPQYNERFDTTHRQVKRW